MDGAGVPVGPVGQRFLIVPVIQQSVFFIQRHCVQAAMSAVSSFAQSIVRDYLREKGYTDTLECLTNEMQAKGASAPSVESWYEVSRSLGLPELIRKNNSPGGSKYVTIVEVLLEKLTDIIVKDTKATADVKVTVHDREPREFSKSINPNFSKSTNQIKQPLQEGVRLGQRPNLKERKLRDRSTKGSSSLAVVNSTSKAQNFTKLKVNTPLSTLGAGAEDMKRKKHMSKSKTAGALVVASSFDDDAADNGVRSTENWIPMEVRMRMVGDEIANAAFKEAERHREQRRLKKWQTEITALDLEKVKDKYSQKRCKFCALCEQQYLALNLPMTVSYKAIMDLRLSWGHTGVDSILSKPPRCYDVVRVCTFCAQVTTRARSHVWCLVFVFSKVLHRSVLT